MRPCIDGLEGASDGPILVIAAVKSANVESVDDPQEVGALDEGAVMANSAWEVPLWRVDCRQATPRGT